MEIDIRQSPSFAVARITLAGGESCKAESGAMMATSDGVGVESKMEGGLMKGLKRSVLGGESLYMSTYTAPSQGGWVDFAAHLPGDVAILEVDGGINLTKGSWLCSSGEITIDTKWGGMKNLAGGEGGFLVRAEGRGKTVAACYGALEPLTLAGGEKLVLDSGHLVAFTDGTEFTTRKVASGMMQTMKSGEGLVFEFTGPGQIWTQTRNQRGLISWLTTVLPFSRG